MKSKVFFLFIAFILGFVFITVLASDKNLGSVSIDSENTNDSMFGLQIVGGSDDKCKHKNTKRIRRPRCTRSCIYQCSDCTSTKTVTGSTCNSLCDNCPEIECNSESGTCLKDGCDGTYEYSGTGYSESKKSYKVCTDCGAVL